MSKELVFIPSPEDPSNKDQQFGELYLDWLPKIESINPIPISFDVEEKNNLNRFLQVLDIYFNFPSKICFFIPVLSPDYTSSEFNQPLRASTDAYYRSYYYLYIPYQNKTADTTPPYYWASTPATTFFSQSELILSHLDRTSQFFGPELKIVPEEIIRAEWGSVPDEYGDRLKNRKWPGNPAIPYQKGFPASQLLDLTSQIPPANHTFNTYLHELVNQGEHTWSNQGQLDLL